MVAELVSPLVLPYQHHQGELSSCALASPSNATTGRVKVCTPALMPLGTAHPYSHLQSQLHCAAQVKYGTPSSQVLQLVRSRGSSPALYDPGPAIQTSADREEWGGRSLSLGSHYLTWCGQLFQAHALKPASLCGLGAVQDLHSGMLPMMRGGVWGWGQLSRMQQ